MAYKLKDYQQELVEKAREEMRRGKKHIMIVSPPGSGKSVVISEIAKLTTSRGGTVLFLVHRKELVEQIKHSFSFHGVPKEQSIIETVGKVKRRMEHYPKPSLIITDEGHHGLAKTYRDIYDFFSDVPRLGFTATPWRLSGQGFEDLYDVMVEGKSVKWLIEHQSLAPFRYFEPTLINRNKLKHSRGEFTNRSINEAMSKKIYGDAIKHYQKIANGKKAILYAHNVEMSKKIAQAFVNAGIQAIHADAKTPVKERDKIMDDFRNGNIQVLCNVDLISEGFDVPDCEVTILMRPTESLVLFLQQAMRSMRYKEGKTAIIIDHVGNSSKHGYPNNHHQWDLKGHKKNSQDRKENLGTIECPMCTAVIFKDEFEGVCIVCGYEIPEKEKHEMQIDENAELVEANTFIQTNYLITKRPQDLNTVDELKEYARLKGYKPGWVYHQQKQRGWL